jgi:protein dithiol oxidoreductase (disulfide-forming)
MHQNIRVMLLVLTTVCLFITGTAQALNEGTDYKVVANPQPTEAPAGKVEVLELFWYGCPHCYHLEADLTTWLAHKPDYIVFRRMPAVLGSNWALDGQAFYAAELLGVLDRIHAPLFKALHQEHLHLSDENSLADWFVTQGVNRDEFLKAMHSFVVDMKVRRAGQIDQAFGIDGVPAFVINGKYTTSPGMTAGNEKAFQVVDYLAAREAGVTPKSTNSIPKVVSMPMAKEEQPHAVIAH